MATAAHTGNVIIVLDKPVGKSNPSILLGRKRPKKDNGAKRKRKRIGVGRWVPPGGATEYADKSQKHAAQRELRQETGLVLPLKSFEKVGILKGYTDLSGSMTWLVHIYLVNAGKNWQSFVPNEEYFEMKWFQLSKLPFDKMLEGDREWLPKIARGKKLSIKLVSNPNADKAFSIDVREVRSFN